jgi:glutathione S-transferase
MPALELIELHPSPWSERVRWALEWKGVDYARRPFVPIAGEEELRRTTGLSTVPVLLAGGEVIGDSDAAVGWLEERHPTPPLLPADPRERAQVRAWELTATEVLAPFGRLVMIGRYKTLGLQPLADHFAAKYGWSPATEARADRILRGLLRDLEGALERAPYLVGDAFTRADLTVAAMLNPIVGLPPDELYEVDPGMRGMFGIAPDDEAAFATLRRWRDAVYRRHRGRRVTQPPPAP